MSPSDHFSRTSPRTPDLVLVVDDSPETLGMLNDALEQAGMTTLVALEGRQALNIARKMTPDIILLDAMMPTLDGFDTCALLKKDLELKNIPVIFMTGLADTDSVVRAFAAGGVDYVTKPVNPLELIARIKVHLGNARTTRSAQAALDTTGQSLCAVNSDGELLWATPTVNQYLERLNAESPQPLQLAESLSRWLHRQPAAGAQLSLSAAGKTLKWLMIGAAGADEYLLRLVSDDQPDECELLKQHFSVTSREAEVLLWVARGKTNREIAQILELSPRTINKHLEQLFRKIGVENRTTAATQAVAILQKSRV
jgi:DNA-binding response OmpR family regulator/DNA-binding CsgD family transcriptional regulator